MAEKVASEVNAELRFSSCGVHIAVRSAPNILEKVQRHLPPDSRSSTKKLVDRSYHIVTSTDLCESRCDRGLILRADSSELVRSLSVSDLLKVFETDSRIFIGEMTRQRVFLHAGVVGWHGMAILIPGRSWSGKTTLVAALVREGATYFSDEYALLDRRAWVHPYLKPLSIRNKKTALAREYPIDEFGGVAAKGPLPVRLVVVSQYQSGATWTPEKLSAADGLMALADNSVSIRRSPELVLSTLKRLVGNVETIRGLRGEAKQVVDFIRKHY